MNSRLILLVLLMTTAVHAQLAVTVNPPKATGSKAVVSMTLKNNFTEKVESARAVAFLLDENGKMIGQSSRWVIGGGKDHPALESKGETKFNFVIPVARSVAPTNLTIKLNFTRLVLDGGKIVDANKNVTVTTRGK